MKGGICNYVLKGRYIMDNKYGNYIFETDEKISEKQYFVVICYDI